MKKMLYILGDELARMTGQQAMVFRGMIRLAVEEECGSSNPAAVENYLDNLSFTGWQKLLNNQGLCRRMSNIGVKDVTMVVSQAQKTLIERQSLFTLAAR